MTEERMIVDVDQYMEFVDQTTSIPSKNNGEFIARIAELDKKGVDIARLMTAAVGISAEGGEFTEIVKKIAFQGKELTEDTKTHLVKELGDVFWYIAQACNALDLENLIKDENYKSNSLRSENMNELKKILEDKLSNKTTNEWVKQFENLKIPCGPIYNIKEAVENPQIEARNMIVKAYHKVIGEFKLAGNPIKMSSYKDENKRGDIPDLDEHRKKILEEFI